MQILKVRVLPTDWIASVNHTPRGTLSPSSPFLSLSFSVSLSLPIFLSLLPSLILFLCPYVSFSVTFYLSLSLSLFTCVLLSVSLSMFYPLCLSLSFFFFCDLSISSVCLSLPHSFSLRMCQVETASGILPGCCLFLFIFGIHYLG